MKNMFTLISVILLAACSTNSNNNIVADDNVIVDDTTTSAAINIPFTEAKNYFVKNTFKTDSLTDIKIIAQKDFEDIFGMASTMSADGKPTAIDFSKQYAIAVIQPATDTATSLKVESLTGKENNIVLNYSKTVGEKQSFTTRPFILLIVDNMYTGDLTVQQQ